MPTVLDGIEVEGRASFEHYDRQIACIIHVDKAIAFQDSGDFAAVFSGANTAQDEVPFAFDLFYGKS